jgi:hypothetical protein
MREVTTTTTKYVTEDENQFDSPIDALKHELLLYRVNDALSQLPPRPKSMEFSNGKGYILHNRYVAMNAYLQLVGIARDYIGEEMREVESRPGFKGWGIETAEWFDFHFSRVGDNPTLSHAFYRFRAMDSSFREWGQIYFALNPNEGLNVRLV